MNINPDLRQWFGDIDIYLFDQLLKGRFLPGMRVLDAGCGGGRNLIYFLRSGFDVFAVDSSAEAIEQTQALARTLAPHLPVENFHCESIENLSFDDEQFHAVISSAVLHFANDEEQFLNMVLQMWRVLKPGGIFFARLASIIGIEREVKHLVGRRYHLPDGSDRFLVDEEMLIYISKQLGGKFLEPIKTVNVQNMRCMTTWCLKK